MKAGIGGFPAAPAGAGAPCLTRRRGVVGAGARGRAAEPAPPWRRHGADVARTECLHVGLGRAPAHSAVGRCCDRSDTRLPRLRAGHHVGGWLSSGGTPGRSGSSRPARGRCHHVGHTRAGEIKTPLPSACWNSAGAA